MQSAASHERRNHARMARPARHNTHRLITAASSVEVACVVSVVGLLMAVAFAIGW